MVIRMRPNAGLPGINGIIVLKTWRTLTRIPNATIVQYGTWFVKSRNEHVNGDNCYAAQWNTFEKFTLWWNREFLREYNVSLRQRKTVSCIECTMNAVARNHNLTIITDPHSLVQGHIRRRSSVR